MKFEARREKRGRKRKKSTIAQLLFCHAHMLDHWEEIVASLPTQS